MATNTTALRATVRLLLQQVTLSGPLDESVADIDVHIKAAYRWWLDNTEKRVKDVSIKASMGANSVIVTPETTVIYPEILEVYLVGPSGDTEGPLQPMEWSELRNRQQVNPTPATPTHYAIRRIGANAPTGTDQNKWELAVYPITDAGWAVRGLVRDNADLPGLASTSISLGDYEIRCVAILAAIYAAPGAGRPDFAEDMMWFFPQALRDKIAAHVSHEEILN